MTPFPYMMKVGVEGARVCASFCALAMCVQKITLPGFRTLYCTVFVTVCPLGGEISNFWAYEKNEHEFELRTEPSRVYLLEGSIANDSQ